MPPISITVPTITGSHQIATATTNNANVSATTNASSTSNSADTLGYQQSNAGIRQNMYSGPRLPRQAANPNGQGTTSESVHAANDETMPWTYVVPPRRITAGSSNRTNTGLKKFYIQNSIEPSDRPLHLPLAVNRRIRAKIPLPPNWNENIKTVANETLHPYRLFSVDSKSHEFRILAELLNPLSVCYIDQIVNPMLWTRFVNARNEMMRTKCNDPKVLKKLGLNDKEIAQRQQSLNFVRHNAVDAAPFDDNFALLFHCTRDLENVELIQRHGFDERLSRGGTLGRGIYFADSSEKAAGYDRSNTGVIFICGVLLGDCVKDPAGGSDFELLKEPEKLLAERRYIDDYNFDSVMGNVALNEYAVYNRYRCYPMYKVTFSRMQSRDPADASEYATLPPFVWPAHNQLHNAVVNSAWRLHAKNVFDDMKRLGALQ